MPKLTTEELLERIVRAVKQLQGKLKEHDQAIEDLWKKLGDDFDAEVSLVDETVEKVERNHRRVIRLEKRVEALEQTDE